MREKTGESLRSIKGGAPLRDVSTASLEALRKYTEGSRLSYNGDDRAGLALLEEAVALDSTFATAWRLIANVVGNNRLGRERQVNAIESAYRHRDRLTDKERYFTEELYHGIVTGDRDARVQALENVLRIDPENPIALNNLSAGRGARGDYVGAEALLRRAVTVPGVTANARSNLVMNQIRQGNEEGARAALTELADAYPAAPIQYEVGFWVHMFAGDERAAAESVGALLVLPGLLARWQVDGERDLGEIPGLHGRFAEAERHFENAARLAARDMGPAAAVSERLRAARRRVLAGDVETARTQLAAIEQSGLFEAAPREERPWAGIVHIHILIGDRAGALRYLERWQAEMPAGYINPGNRSEMTFLQVWARGGDPANLLQALDTHRRDTPCSRCNRMQESEWLEATGRANEARAVLREMLTLPGDLSEALAGRAWALENLGRLADAVGDKAEAVDAYRRFVELCAEADPVFQPRVRHARERIAALGG